MIMCLCLSPGINIDSNVNHFEFSLCGFHFWDNKRAQENIEIFVLYSNFIRSLPIQNLTLLLMFR